MCRLKSLLIYDLPIQTEYITTQFSETHKKHQAEMPEWSTEATRQKLISQYWFSYVSMHFAVMIGLPLSVVSLVYFFVQSEFYVLSVFVAALLSFPVLYIFQYQPNFSSLFLPRLQTIKEAYERTETAKLEKCRQAQLSNFSLALFFYVLTSVNQINSIKCDDFSANLLMKLYGVDPGSMKRNLELIMGTAKRRNMSERKVTEVRNRFNETYEFLEELQFYAGIQKLKELESTFFNN